MRILGISAYYHDSAACMVVDGEIVAAAQEERFSREKHDASFPENAVRYCLAESNITDGQLDAVTFYDKPILKFHRILETHLCTAPNGFAPFKRAIPEWLRVKLWLPPKIETALESCGINSEYKLFFPEHHESHAASAFYPSPFDQAAVLTIDGVGEWACATIGQGKGNRLDISQELEFPHSLGLLYSAFTYFTGFKVNSGEYKLMGLAPYGEDKYSDLIREHLIDLKDDGSFRLNMEYFGFLDDLVMITDKFSDLFGGPPRSEVDEITQRELDIARSIQVVTEEIVLRMARHTRSITGQRNLCMAGGVALNCVANGRLAKEEIFDQIWVQPAATDAGGAIGAALTVWHNEFDQPRLRREPVKFSTVPATSSDAPGFPAYQHADDMHGSLLGPSFSNTQIREYLDYQGLPYHTLEDEDWAATVAKLIADENVIGLFCGRMEFGPRALGSRSILADPRSPAMQSVLNQKIKYRESFRPFAAACLEDRVQDLFDTAHPSPYMLMVIPVRQSVRHNGSSSDGHRNLDLHAWINEKRSTVPAITHVDYSVRLQAVSPTSNPAFHAILKAFYELTGCPALVNTSFNVRGEPIVCTPSDAYSCFMRTEMDHLVLENQLLNKEEQGTWSDNVNWQQSFKLD